MGDRGPTPPVRGRWPEGPEGVGWATRSTGTVLLWSRPPAILWVLSHRWESTSPPAGGEIPCENLQKRRAEVVAAYKDAGKRLFLPLPLPGGKALVDPLPGVVDELEHGLVQNGVVPGQGG